MDVIKCDRCGCVYELFDEGQRVSFPGNARRDLDLCARCEKDLDRFIAGKIVVDVTKKNRRQKNG